MTQEDFDTIWAAIQENALITGSKEAWVHAYQLLTVIEEKGFYAGRIEAILIGHALAGKERPPLPEDDITLAQVIHYDKYKSTPKNTRKGKE